MTWTPSCPICGDIADQNGRCVGAGGVQCPNPAESPDVAQVWKDRRGPGILVGKDAKRLLIGLYVPMGWWTAWWLVEAWPGLYILAHILRDVGVMTAGRIMVGMPQPEWRGASADPRTEGEDHGPSGTT
jgi:hypothetical protein